MAKKLLTITLFLCLTSFVSSAQEKFKWEASIKKVYSTQFYKIFLSPMVTSELTSNFSDVRLYTKNNTEIPYFIMKNRDIRFYQEKKFFRIIEKNYEKRKHYNRIIFENEEKTVINNICFLSGKEKENVWIQISGSYDKKNWHIIQGESPYLIHPNNNSEFNEIKITNLPRTTYKFYELRIFDTDEGNKITPEKIYKYKTQTSDIKYVKLPEPKITQKQSKTGKFSLIKIHFNASHYIDKIKFNISAPEYYRREANISNTIIPTEKNLKENYYNKRNKTFELSSESDNVFNLTNYRTKTLKLKIDNKDSEPLTINSVEAYQVQKYLVAKLKKNKNYILRFGNKNIKHPLYDLRYFRDSISNNLPPAKIKNKISANPVDKSSDDSILNIPRFYLWLIITLILLMLVIISIKITEDIQEGE